MGNPERDAGGWFRHTGLAPLGRACRGQPVDL